MTMANGTGTSTELNRTVPTRTLSNLDHKSPHLLNVRHAPLLSGQWLVLAQCSCRGVMFDVVQGMVDDERILRRLRCSNHAADVRRTFFRLARPQFELIEALGGSLPALQPHGRAWTDPDEVVDPHLVTFDARLHPVPGTRTTMAAEVALTSGGWVRVNRVKNPDYTGAVAQLHAAVAAMALFPHGSSVRLLCPSSHKVATAVRSVQAKRGRLRWVPEPLHQSLSTYLDSRDVCVAEPQGAPTPLMRTAATLVDECGDEGWEPSTSPLLDWVRPEGMPVTKPKRPVPRLVEKRRPRHGYFR